VEEEQFKQLKETDVMNLETKVVTTFSMALIKMVRVVLYQTTDKASKVLKRT
jgi:hypothetical protein